jgi:hypothetical protein
MHNQIDIFIFFLIDSFIFVVFFHSFFFELVFDGFFLADFLEQNALENAYENLHEPVFENGDSDFDFEVVVFIEDAFVDDPDIILVEEFLDQLDEVVLPERLRQSGNPTFKKVFVVDVDTVGVDHPAAADGGETGLTQVVDFEDDERFFVQSNLVRVFQTQFLRVVQNAVHVLDPQRVDWPVECQQFRVLARVVEVAAQRFAANSFVELHRFLVHETK